MKLLVFAALIAVSTAARLEHLQQKQLLRQYLPPSQNSGYSSYQTYGSNADAYGSNSGTYNSASVNPGTFGSAGTSSGTYGASGAGQYSYDAFPGVKNAYLPPKYESPATSASAQYSGSVQGIGAQNALNQQYSQPGEDSQEYVQPTAFNQQYDQQSGLNQQYTQQSDLSQQYGQQTGFNQQYGQQAAVSQFDYQAATQSTNRFSVQSTRYQSQPSAVNRQYLAPYTSSSYSSQDIPQQAFDEKTGYYY